MPLDKIPQSPIEKSPIFAPPDKKNHQPVGPLVGIVIIMLLMVVGALYFWGEQLNKQSAEPSYIPGDATVSQ